MTVTLTPELEERIKKEAARQGVAPDEYANQVLDERLSEVEQVRQKKLMALLQSWNEEEVDDNEALDEEFLQQLDADRTSARKLFPPELKGISW